jgi:integrase
MPRRNENIRLLDASSRYQERIQNEGQAAASIKTARYALSRMARALATTREPNPWLHLITDRDMDTYCFGPNGIRRGIGSVSFNRYRSVLKVFFEYCLLMRWIDKNPMDAIPRARPDTPVAPLMLSAIELTQLLNFAETPMERIALSVGMNTGLRSNDVRHLTVLDANVATGELQTEIRKTRKLDVKPITMELHTELMRWFEAYAGLAGLNSPADIPGDWLLIPSYHYTPRSIGPGWSERSEPCIILRPTQVMTKPWRLVQRPLARMGFPTYGTGFHTLRRSSARALFELLRAEEGGGRDHALMVVKAFLNHTHTSQTEHYLRLNQERVIRDTLLRDKSFLPALAEVEQARIDTGVEPVARLDEHRKDQSA